MGLSLGEDGIAGISDDNQFVCFALALWNGEDPILKERIFGVTNFEGNHGRMSRNTIFTWIGPPPILT